MNFSILLLRKFLFSKRSDSLIRIISWVCLCGVTIGIAAMIVVMSVMNGLNQNIHKRLLSTEPHILIQNIEEDKLMMLKSHFQNDILEKTERQDVILKTLEGIYGGAIAKGVEPKSLQRLIQAQDKAHSDLELSDGEIAVGIDLAYSLHIFEDDEIIITLPDALLAGDTEIPKVEKLRVKYLLRTNVADVDSSMVFYNIQSRTLKSFYDSSSLTKSFELYLTNTSDLDSSAGFLKSKNLPFTTWKEQNSHLLYALKMERILIGVFLGMAILIAAFTILTVLALLIIQKRKDIGTLMSFGISSQKASYIFTQLGFYLTFIGISSGTILGLILCFILKTFPILKLPADIYYDSKVPVSVQFSFVFGIIIFSLLIAFIGSYLPSRYVSKFTPAECLKAKS